MPTRSVESPPHPRAERTVPRWAGALGFASALLLALVVLRWNPLMRLDADIADTSHGWAVDADAMTQACRILTDWVWDPWTMRLLCAVAVVLLLRRPGARWTAGWLVVVVALSTAVQQGLKAA